MVTGTATVRTTNSPYGDESARLPFLFRVFPAVLGLSIAAGTGSAGAADWRVVPSIAISETYTDNVRLAPPGMEESDWVTDINPGLTVSGVGARASVRADYNPSVLAFARQNEVDFRHSLSGTGQVEMVEDHLFLNGSASMRETFRSPFGQISASPYNLTEDRRLLTTFSVGPRWEHRFGSWADLTLAYRYQFTDRHGVDAEDEDVPTFSDSSRHSTTATVSSGTNFQRFRWSVTATRTEENRRNRPQSNDFSDRLVRANASYNLNRTVALTGSVGYRDLGQSGSFAGRDSVIWDAGVRLTPSRRTQLSVSYGKQPRNKRVTVSGSYQVSSRTSMTVSYNEDYRTSQGLLGEDLSQLQEIPIQLPDGTVVTVPIVPDPGGNLDGIPDFPFTDRVFRQDRFSFGFSHSKHRTSLSVSTYIEKRTFDGRDQEDAVGIRGQISRQFSRAVDGSLSVDYSNREFGAQEDDLYFATANLDYQLASNLTGYLTYRLTRRSSNAAERDIDENAVTTGVRAEF